MGFGSTLLTGSTPFVSDDSYNLGSPMNPVGASGTASAPASPGSSLMTVGNLSLLTTILGGINSAIGGYEQAK
jgi:hypothetical protein